MKKILIVGGVAGGASAAARARRMSESAEIIMFDRGPYVSFANCGLPYHISGEIAERDALVLQTPESFQRRFNVEVRLHTEVVAIDRETKSIEVQDRQSGRAYRESYDLLLLSPGAAPIVPSLPGIDNPLTHSLRSLPDMDRILRLLETERPEHATVVGGGFIGLEMAEALRHRGLSVTLLEQAAQVMAPMDPEMAEFVHQALREKGIDLRLEQGLEAADYQPQQPALALTLTSGDTLTSGLLIMAIGVRPEIALAKQAGLAIGEAGGIRVDAQMRTSDPCIYAVGDAVEHTELVNGHQILLPLAGPANRQGRIAADNMLGGQRTYNRTQGTAICRVFELAVAATGLNEKTLKRLGRAYQKVYVHAGSHAGYFPGAQPVSLKLLFDPQDGRILGAQAVGKDGVDKRIDVLAVALRAGMSVFDLEDLELTYAPPYGSAKDVVNLAGFVGANLLRGETAICQAEEVVAPTGQQWLLDVRNPEELLRCGEIPGAANIPLNSLRERLDELPRDKEILVICQVGLRGHVAQRLLSQRGYRARNLTGGYKTFEMAIRAAGQQEK